MAAPTPRWGGGRAAGRPTLRAASDLALAEARGGGAEEEPPPPARRDWLLAKAAEQIAQAAKKTIPAVAPVFFSFRLMVGLGILFLATFVLALWFCARRSLLLEKRRWFLRWALWAIPLAWLAAEFGWIVAEVGRQPWTIAGILPTSLSASSLTAGDLYLCIAGFVVFYTVLFIIEIMLMFKYARLGPSSLPTGRYHHEQPAPDRALNQPLPTNHHD